MITLIRPNDDLLLQVKDNLRESDIREVEALGFTPWGAIVTSVQKSNYCQVAVTEDGPLCVFGLVLVDEIGVPWALGTNLIKKHTKEFIVRSREVIECYLSKVDTLTNWVDERNLVSIRWLKFMGFEFYERSAIGINGEAFLKFYMEK